MTGLQRDLRELDVEARRLARGPATVAEARTDLALIAGYPPPDDVQLLAPSRLAHRWGWSTHRVRALIAQVDRIRRGSATKTQEGT